MSIFGKILSKIFPSNHPAVTQATAPAAPAASTSAAAPASPAAAAPPVDVESVLNDMAKKNPEKLNWRTSIVDLMKLVGMDSSLTARKELAKELNYTGNTNDSASTNMWLHKQVMRKIAENGGKLPADMKD
jgi:3-oxoacyl-ACP reductase-like protein